MNTAAYAVTATTLKLQLALEQLPWRTPAVAQTLHHWLGELLGREALTRWEQIALGVSLTSDLRGLTWRVSDEAGAFIPRLARYFEHAEVSPAEMDHIAQAGAAFQPARLEGWIEVYDGNLNAGWSFPQLLPLSEALEHSATGPARAPLADWAARHNVTTCTRLGRAVGGEHPYTQLQIPLPGVDVAQQLAAGLNAFAALDLAAPPATALTALRQAANPGLALSAWLSATGIVKLGLVASQPSTGLVVRLYHATQQGALDEALAAFEGALDVAGPAGIEVQRLAQGGNVTCHYTLLRHTAL